MDETGNKCELCNLATAPNERRRGYASYLLRHLLKLYRPRCRYMEVGTSEDMEPFYARFGFVHQRTIEGFFRQRAYAEAGVVFDDPQLGDMQVMRIDL